MIRLSYWSPPARSGINEEATSAIDDITTITFQNFSCFRKKFIRVVKFRPLLLRWRKFSILSFKYNVYFQVIYSTAMYENVSKFYYPIIVFL